MFLIIGSGNLAIRLATWCQSSRSCIIVGLSEKLPVQQQDELENVEVMALPHAVSLNSLPLGDRNPTAVLLLDPSALDDSDPIQALNTMWPNVPILTTLPLQGDGIDLVSIDDVSFAAIQDRIRAWDRNDGSTVVQHYLSSVPSGSKVAIFCHDNPDPDALAAGLAIHEFVNTMDLDAKLYHGGLIEHQQNRAMVHLLDIPVRRLILDWEVADVLRESDVIITVDFHRPGANNILPEDCVPHIIIDHHSVETSVAADITMVRPEFSATSSMVASLLMSINFPMNARVATALAFGIRTDTLGFTRDFNAVDIRALSWLNAWVDSDLLRSIEAPPRSQQTLESFSEGLNNRVLVGKTLLAPISQMPNRDALAQIADFLLPTADVDNVIVFGPRRGRIILSARTSNPDIHIGRLLAERWPDGLAGGHKALAGGQIPFEVLLDEVVDDVDQASDDALKAMAIELEKVFN
ncbi:MAG: DHH family phosphoesterase [Candidatus Poseidoniaceae archaeon]|nr:DHH family phosphoesterase [Candidatus Poseidoniaceae archaeon]